MMAPIGSDLLYAKQLLAAGEVVAIPTETVYGLAGNAYDEAAVLKIFHVKQRPSFDPLIVHAGSLDQVASFVATWPSKALQLAQHFWPGPLTLLLEKSSLIPDLVTSGLPCVGVRVPEHALTLTLLRQLSFPLAAPSANPFGYMSPTAPQHVLDQLGERIAYVVDGGACCVGIESTIVGFEGEEPVIYRLGGTRVESIEAVVGPTSVIPHMGSNPQAPGMLTSHYAPQKLVQVGELPGLLARHTSQRVGVLAFDRLCPGVLPGHQVVLSPTGDLDEAARHFFGALRTLDGLPVEVILADFVPNVGLGRAINDRLRRAAAPRGQG